MMTVIEICRRSQNTPAKLRTSYLCALAGASGGMPQFQAVFSLLAAVTRPRAAVWGSHGRWKPRYVASYSPWMANTWVNSTSNTGWPPRYPRQKPECPRMKAATWSTGRSTMNRVACVTELAWKAAATLSASSSGLGGDRGHGRARDVQEGQESADQYCLPCGSHTGNSALRKTGLGDGMTPLLLRGRGARRKN